MRTLRAAVFAAILIAAPAAAVLPTLSTDLERSADPIVAWAQSATERPLYVPLLGLLLDRGHLPAPITVPATDTGTPSPTSTGTPTPTPTIPTATPTPLPPLALEVAVEWADVVSPPQQAISVTIQLLDPDVNGAGWEIGDESGRLAEGSIAGSQPVTVRIPIDWSRQPLLGSNRLLYLYAEADDGATFGKAIRVRQHRPVTEATPTPTASCGYGRFQLASGTEAVVEHPQPSFDIAIRNLGEFSCGTLGWALAVPELQGERLACAPSRGHLPPSNGRPPWPAAEITCSVAWATVPRGQPVDAYVIVFAHPGNSTSRVERVRVRLTRP